MSQLRWLAFAVMAAFAGLVMVTLVGYTIMDPGGWAALGLIAAWLVPLAALCLLAHLRPSVAIPVLGVLACAPIGFGVMQLVDYDRWHDWEDRTGPVELIMVVVVAAALAVAGLSRPTAAGVLLLVVALVPVALAAVGAGSDWALALTIGTVLLPVVASGVLYLLAGRTSPGTKGGGRTSGDADVGPRRLAH